MVFIDFRDARSRESTKELYARLALPTADWVGQTSHGIASLNITPIHKWYTLPRATEAYSFWRRWGSIRPLLKDLVKLTAADGLKLSHYDLIYVVSAANPHLSVSGRGRMITGAWLARPGWEIEASDGLWSHVVSLGRGLNSETTGFDIRTLEHETGHIFGLPDLYGESTLGDAAGDWDLMSGYHRGSHLTAWSRVQLGWIAPSQFQCNSESGATFALTPVSTEGGPKAVMIPTGPTSIYVMEARELVGGDVSLCAEGVLIYRVDLKAEEQDVLRVQRRPKELDAAGYSKAVRCGPAYDAALGLEPGAQPSFENDEISVELVRAELGSYRVRVSKRF
jgi:M6 family metalloprotease-like protein